MARVALAWAGGIGSLLALDALRRAEHDVTLVHVLPPEGALREVPSFVIEEQAAALALPLRVERAEPSEADALTRALDAVRADQVAFGYLRGEDYLGMFKVARAARAGGAEPLLPVRHLRPDDAAHALAAAGHRLVVRAVHRDAAWPELVGRFLDPAVIDEVEARLGRAGWALVRTLAIDGPAFARRAGVVAGETRSLDEGWALELSVRGC